MTHARAPYRPHCTERRAARAPVCAALVAGPTLPPRSSFEVLPQNTRSTLHVGARIVDVEPPCPVHVRVVHLVDVSECHVPVGEPGGHRELLAVLGIAMTSIGGHVRSHDLLTVVRPAIDDH